MNSHNYTVYMHKHKENGKVYIGLTGVDPEKRWRKGNGYNTTRHFFSAIKKYGWDAFTHEILATNLTLKEAAQMEIDLIKKYDSTNPAKGYNASTGGENGFKGACHTEETKRILSEKCSGWTHTEEAIEKIIAAGKGRVFTSERRRKISESQKGRIFSDEQRKYMSEARMGMSPWNKGRHWNDIQRKKLSESHKNSAIAVDAARRNIAIAHSYGPYNKKQVACVETGETWPSATEAARAIGCNQTSLSEACRMPHRRCKGYHWRYIDAEVI